MDSRHAVDVEFATHRIADAGLLDVIVQIREQVPRYDVPGLDALEANLKARLDGLVDEGEHERGLT